MINIFGEHNYDVIVFNIILAIIPLDIAFRVGNLLLFG